MRKFPVFYFIVQVLVCLIMPSSVRADTTYVSGIISTNTTWTPAGSPYIVTGNVLVDSSVTLDIQPGVEVRIDSSKYIMIKGILNAIGTEVDSIIITKNGTARWDRLWFKSASAGSLKYCRIEYAGISAIFDSTASSLYIGYNTISNNSGTYSNGGGICNYYGSPTITNNAISNNSTYRSGGGIYNYYGSPTITNNTISNNSAPENSGGGIYNYYGSPTITGNTISNNSARSGGGGIFNHSGSPAITNNTISNNSAFDGGEGGGICTYYGSPTITNNIISNNSAPGGGYGGGIYNGSGSPTITNNIISNNSTTYYGGGIYNGSGSPTITGNTISNNSARSGGGISNNSEDSFTIKYNTITDTTSFAIYLNRYSDSWIRTNNIYSTGYAVYNNTGNNIEARYNYWNTTSTDTINAKIYDYYDDFNKGKVIYEPFLTAPFTDTILPYAPVNLTANGSNPSPWNDNPTFAINWTNPDDLSGISEIYYKLGSAPTSDFDTTGSFHYPPDTITATQQNGQMLYVWLVDGNGDLDYHNYSSVNLRYEIIPPPAPTNLLANSSSPSPWTNDSLFIIAWSNPYDMSGIAKVLYKLGSAPTSNYDTTGSLSGIPPDTVFSSIEGSIPLYLWLVDGAGNVDYNNNSIVNLRYDTASPLAFSLISPIDSSCVNTTRPTFTWQSTSDIVSGLKFYKVNIDGSYQDSTSDTTWTANYDLTEEAHSWYVVACDSVGNFRESNEAWIVIISGAPTDPDISVTPDTLEFSYGKSKSARLSFLEPAENSPELTLPGDKRIVERSPKSQIQEPTTLSFAGVKGTVDTLIYDDGDPGSGYYWGTGTRMAMRMSPSSPCMVLAVQYYCWSRSGTQTIDATLYEWTGSAPGSQLGSPVSVSMSESGRWRTADFSSQNIEVSSDFIAAFCMYNDQTVLGYDEIDCDRAWDYDGSSWSSWNETYFIRAIVEYGEEPVSDTVKQMVVHNTGTADLNVTGITWTPDWIVSAVPDLFTVSPGDSQNITVTVTKNGLSDGTYYANLSIASNDPDMPTYLEPVKFIVALVGIEIPTSPLTFSLKEIRPNPVTKNATIIYTLPKTSDVNLRVYDALGRMVKVLEKANKEPGTYYINWDGSELSSGIYFLRLEAEGYNATRKLLIIK